MSDQKEFIIDVCQKKCLRILKVAPNPINPLVALIHDHENDERYGVDLSNGEMERFIIFKPTCGVFVKGDERTPLSLYGRLFMREGQWYFEDTDLKITHVEHKGPDFQQLELLELKIAVNYYKDF